MWVPQIAKMGMDQSRNSFLILQLRPLLDLLQSYPCLAQIEPIYFLNGGYYVYLLLQMLRQQLLDWRQQRKYFFALIIGHFLEILICQSHLRDMNSVSCLGY